MITWLIRALNNFFMGWQKASRPVWEFRIRFETSKNAWLIELKEDASEAWVAMCSRSDNTDNELHIVKFPSWQEARAHAYTMGLQYAYQEAFYSDYRALAKDTRPVPEHLPAPALESEGLSGALRQQSATRTHLHPVAPAKR